MLSPRRLQVVLLDRPPASPSSSRPPPASAQRRALGAHRPILTAPAVREAEDEARLRRCARTPAAGSPTGATRRDGHRGQQVRILAADLARDRVEHVVDELEKEVDAVARARNQLLDLVGVAGPSASAAAPSRRDSAADAGVDEHRLDQERADGSRRYWKAPRPQPAPGGEALGFSRSAR